MTERERLLSMRKTLGEDEYYSKSVVLALNETPIWACRQCGNPVVIGYCCTNCNSSSPYGYADFDTVEDIMADSTIFDGFVRDKDLCKPECKCKCECKE
jgi:hypothetical protein